MPCGAGTQFYRLFGGKRRLLDAVAQHCLAAYAAEKAVRESHPDLLQATGVGTVLTLLSEPNDRRDPGLSGAAREAIIAAIISDSVAATDLTPSGTAAALRASLPETGRECGKA